MTAPDEAVQIARRRLVNAPDTAEAVVNDLRARWEFVEPGELAALRALYAAVKSPDRAIYVDELDALDAGPAAGYAARREPENWQQRCENCGDIFEHAPGVPTLYCPTCADLDAATAPSELAELRAVADAARDLSATIPAGADDIGPKTRRLLAALDAAPVAETAHKVDVRPMTAAEKRAERLTDQRSEQWLARCTCGAEMLPLYPGEAIAWEQGHLGTRPAAAAETASGEGWHPEAENHRYDDDQE